MSEIKTDNHFNDHVDGIEAFMTARESGKPVLLVLGANWCPDAVAFMEAVRSEEGQSFSQRVSMAVVGVGRHDHNQELVGLLGHDTLEGVPAVFLFDEDSALLNAGEVFRWRTAREETPTAIVKALSDYLDR